MRALSRATALALFVLLVGIGASAALTQPSLSRADSAATLQRQVRELLDREAIRNKVQLYTLLHDGDGLRTDKRGWADEIWTADATFQVINPDGSKMFVDAPEGLRGRETLFRLFGRDLPAGLGIAFRHMLSAPAFDSITATTARTRTVDLNFSGASFQPATAVPQGAVSAFVFHDNWVKEADGEWRKSATTVYCTIGCTRFERPPAKSNDGADSAAPAGEASSTTKQRKTIHG